MIVEIPENRERYCSHCTTIEDGGLDPVKTEQEPHAIEINRGRGCFGSQKKYKWQWKCPGCEEVQL